jgi:hypothetical protein
VFQQKDDPVDPALERLDLLISPAERTYDPLVLGTLTRVPIRTPDVNSRVRRPPYGHKHRDFEVKTVVYCD